MAECTSATQAFIDYYESQKASTCNLDNQQIANRAEYCSTCIPQYETLLSKAATACGAQFDANVSHNYDYVKFAKHFFCTTDASTGEYCDVVYLRGFDYKVPYSQWDPYACGSSCVGQIDQGIREAINNPQLLGNFNIDASLFAGSSNPVSACPGGNAAAGGAAGAAGAAGATGRRLHAIVFGWNLVGI